MARWVTINWTGKFRFRGRIYYRSYKVDAENETKAKQQIVDYISSMASAGFALGTGTNDQDAEVKPYGD